MDGKRGEAWTFEESNLLIELWGDEFVQDQLENQPRRNLEIYKRIASDMKDRIPEFERNANDCRTRIKRLKTKYHEVKRSNKKSGGKRKTFPFYERLDSILGTRPSVNPVNLADSLNDDSVLSDSQSDDMDGHSSIDDENPSAEDQGGDDKADELPKISRPSTPKPGTSRSSTPIPKRKENPPKGKRKRETDELMTKFMEMEERTSKQFWEFEEKRLKSEQTQEKKEGRKKERLRKKGEKKIDNFLPT